MRGSVRRLADAWRGVALAGVIAVAATAVAAAHGGPQLLYALFFGIAFHFLAAHPATEPGIEFCARTVLRLGVGLLGARITATQVAALGWQTAAIVVVAVASTIVVGIVVARRLGLGSQRGVLSGGSVAICGASAALAIAAVLPKAKEGERFTLLVVVTVTALSTIAMVLYPLVARVLGLEPRWAGLFLGGTIHDVAQVVGAGYTLGREAGDAATVVKLFRVALLAVVVVAVAAAFRARPVEEALESPGRVPGRSQARPSPLGGPRPQGAWGPTDRQPLVPWFLWLFAVLVAANSIGLVPAAWHPALDGAARACLVVAIAALGVKTSFAELAAAGWRSFALVVAETLWIAALILGAILVLR